MFKGLEYKQLQQIPRYILVSIIGLIAHLAHKSFTLREYIPLIWFDILHLQFNVVYKNEVLKM